MPPTRHNRMTTRTMAIWAFALAFVAACDSNPTPHPNQPDATREIREPNDLEPSLPEGDAFGTETTDTTYGDAYSGFEDFTDCDATDTGPADTTDTGPTDTTDIGPTDTTDTPCLPCIGESDGGFQGPPTGPR